MPERQLLTPTVSCADIIRLDARPRPATANAHSVIYQYGQGNVASLPDNRMAGQHQGSAATGPASTAGNASQRMGGGVSPCWYVACAVGGVAVWELPQWKFAAWRTRPG